MGIAWHAPYEILKPETRDMARAIHSLMEELEAIDWYGQRADVCDDEALRATLLHNQNEEKEHAAMVLEWIRRHDPAFDRYLREYLFTAGDLLAIEAGGFPQFRNPQSAIEYAFYEVQQMEWRRLAVVEP